MSRMPCSLVVLLFLGVLVPRAEAQADRAEWLAWRAGKEARYARVTPNPQRDVLVLTGIRAFPDPAGHIVVVGEARNASSRPLAYTRVHFTFLGNDGRTLGTEWSYVFGGTVGAEWSSVFGGGRLARILESGLNETVLLPGTTGFFKVWTAIPFALVASHPMLSAGDDLPFGPTASGTSPPGTPPQQWNPVLRLSTLSMAGGRISGSVQSWATPDTLSYGIRVSVAVYQNGTISDVQSTVAAGPRPGDPCNGEASTGILSEFSSGPSSRQPDTTSEHIRDRAVFEMALAQPGDRIARTSFDWEDRGVSGKRLSFTETADSRTLTVADKCGFLIQSSAPWIRVVERPLPGQAAGNLTIAVDENTGGARAGTVSVNGASISVTQSALVRCEDWVAAPSIVVGPARSAHRVSFGSTCSSGRALSLISDAPWLNVDWERFSFYQTLLLRVAPNTTGQARRARATVGNAVLTVDQQPYSRGLDLNGDGGLDLLWHHAANGQVAAWLLDGSTMTAGVPIGSGPVSDLNWVPVTVADTTHDGITDIIWRHRADGRLARWVLAGTTVSSALPLTGASVPDLTWQVRSAGDFNGDGHPDLLWQRDSTGELLVWFLWYEPAFGNQENQARLLATAALGPGAVADLQWQIAGSADFNADGWPDLVLQHQGDGRIAVWLMSGTTLLSEVAVTPGQVADLAWKIRAVGDINRDDRPDLIWQHRTTGDLAAWLMDGTRQLRAVSLGQVADTDWVIVGPK